jgi:hypothetical protein
MKRQSRKRLMIPRILFALAFTASPCLAASVLDNRPAFSEGNEPAKKPATCQELRRMSAGLKPPDTRIDLAIIGELTLVKPDGALWYMAMCQDVQVMCVTYQQNGMKAGDRVLFRGAYARLDENHVVLAPCLADPQ